MHSRHVRTLGDVDSSQTSFVYRQVLCAGAGRETCIHSSVGEGAGVVVCHFHQVCRHGPLPLGQALAQLMQRHLYPLLPQLLYEKGKERDYTFWRQSNEKPSITPDCCCMTSCDQNLSQFLAAKTLVRGDLLTL
jgi:hypothetical protein